MTDERVPTPLFLATSHGYLAGVDTLMKAAVAQKDLKACIQLALTKGETVVLQKFAEQDLETVLSLGGTGAHSSSILQTSFESLLKSFLWNANNLSQAMIQAIRQKNMKLFHLLMQQFDLLDGKSRKETADKLPGVLQIAVEHQKVEAVKSLQANVVDIAAPIIAQLGQDEPTSTSCTLLHQAVHLNALGITSLLLRDISPNVTDERGRTPLHYAVEHQPELTDILLASGANDTLRDNRGWMPLHVAAHYARGGSVSSLLDAGAQIDALDAAGMNPLHHCAFSIRWIPQYPSPVMPHLLKAGASVSSLDRDGYTPFQLYLVRSIRNNIPDVLSTILDQQTDLVFAKFPPRDRTVLHLAAEADCGSSLIRMLLSRGADLEAEDKDGKTPIKVAAKSAHRLLINLGARWKE